MLWQIGDFDYDKFLWHCFDHYLRFLSKKNRYSSAFTSHSRKFNLCKCWYGQTTTGFVVFRFLLMCGQKGCCHILKLNGFCESTNVRSKFSSLYPELKSNLGFFKCIGQCLQMSSCKLFYPSLHSRYLLVMAISRQVYHDCLDGRETFCLNYRLQWTFELHRRDSLKSYFFELDCFTENGSPYRPLIVGTLFQWDFVALYFLLIPLSILGLFDLVGSA